MNVITNNNNSHIEKYENVSEKDPFEEIYEVGPILGKGGFGTVYDGRRIKDNSPVAFKQIFRENVMAWDEIDGNEVPLEISLMSKLGHIPGVIKLLDWFESEEFFVIVMERPEMAIDLFDFITQKKFLKESLSQRFFLQVVETVIACHEAGVVHRDIKDENILVDTRTHTLKIIDFGSGDYLEDSAYPHFYGTPLYYPPECIKYNLYESQSATVWSLGILLYDMVCGVLPFETEADISAADLKFPNSLSTECRDLIRKCLLICPFDRPSLEEILYHPWMTAVFGNEVLPEILENKRTILSLHSIDDQFFNSSQNSIFLDQIVS